jgi:NitT/TauT family transport system ATP-binding protein
MTGVAISVDRVSHIYGANGRKTLALDDVSLDIAPGEFVVFLGPSGCGKSTLLLALAGLLRPSQGTVSVGGEQLEKPFTDVGVVFQDAVLLDWRTALQNILLQTEVRRIPKDRAADRARTLMASAGIADFENVYPSELSGGMQQRVSICRALVHEPSLLLMDEPFSALDALTRDQMAVDLQALCLENEKTVVFVTHSIPEAVLLADRIVVFSPRPGRILEVVDVSQPRPRRLRDRGSSAFSETVTRITDIMRAQGVLHDE